MFGWFCTVNQEVKQFVGRMKALLHNSISKTGLRTHGDPSGGSEEGLRGLDLDLVPPQPHRDKRQINTGSKFISVYTRVVQIKL